MAAWKELSRDNLEASKALLAGEHWRSSINRSYYAACCAISQALVTRGVQFARGWNNPPHEPLLTLIRNGLPLPRQTRQPLFQAVRRLRFARESADYRPGMSVDHVLALGCLCDAGIVFRALED